MWIINGQDIKMTEGDYGITLPVKIKGATFEAEDKIQFTIKAKKNDETALFSKSFSIVSENIVNLVFTESETSSLPVGNYIYTLDWYKPNEFMCNLIPEGNFVILDKA